MFEANVCCGGCCIWLFPRLTRNAKQIPGRVSSVNTNNKNPPHCDIRLPPRLNSRQHSTSRPACNCCSGKFVVFSCLDSCIMAGLWLARRGAGAGEAPPVWLLREVCPHSLDTDTDTNIIIARERPSPRNNLLIIYTV